MDTISTNTHHGHCKQELQYLFWSQTLWYLGRHGLGLAEPPYNQSLSILCEMMIQRQLKRYAFSLEVMILFLHVLESKNVVQHTYNNMSRSRYEIDPSPARHSFWNRNHATSVKSIGPDYLLHLKISASMKINGIITTQNLHLCLCKLDSRLYLYTRTLHIAGCKSSPIIRLPSKR